MDQAGPAGRAEVDRRDRTGNPGMVAQDVVPGTVDRHERGRHEKRIQAVSRNESCTPAVSPRW